MLQDTTEFTYQRERPARIGLTYRVNSGRGKDGRIRMHTVGGLLMHSSLVTAEGLPLGLAAVKFWTREKFKGTAALKKKLTRHGFRSRTRRAFAGWKTYASRQRSSATPRASRERHLRVVLYGSGALSNFDRMLRRSYGRRLRPTGRCKS